MREIDFSFSFENGGGKKIYAFQPRFPPPRKKEQNLSMFFLLRFFSLRPSFSSLSFYFLSFSPSFPKSQSGNARAGSKARPLALLSRFRAQCRAFREVAFLKRHLPSVNAQYADAPEFTPTLSLLLSSPLLSSLLVLSRCVAEAAQGVSAYLKRAG